MVSLRERKSRPSYAAIHAALDGLSDEDDRASASGNAGQQAAGSGDEAQGAGPSTQAKRKRPTADASSDIDMREGNPDARSASGSVVGSDDAASLSSGDSSEFAPSEASGKPKRGRAAGKGKRAAGAIGAASAAPSDSEVASEDLTDEDIGDDGDVEMEDDVADDDLVHVTTPPRKPTKSTHSRPPLAARTSTGTPGRAGTPLGTPGPRAVVASGTAVVRENNINDMPVEYRTLLKTSTQEMVKVVAAPVLPPPARIAMAHAAQASSGDKGRTPSGLDSLPYGPRTPYITRLTHPPAPAPGGSRTSEVKVLEGGTELERRERSLYVARGMSWLSPWQAWEGDGWWPEMCNGEDKFAASSEAGPSRPTGWRSREEVRLGLDQVGRATLGDLNIIAERCGLVATALTSMGGSLRVLARRSNTCQLQGTAKDSPLSQSTLAHTDPRPHIPSRCSKPVLSVRLRA